MKYFPNTILIAASIIFVWFSFDILIQTGYNTHIDFTKGSSYGSMLGGIFSFLSVVLIYLTLKHQTTSYENSAFENRFFQLINYHRNNVETLEYRNPASKKTEIIKGQKIFVNIHKEITKAINYLNNDLKLNNLAIILKDEAIIELKQNKTISTRTINLLELEISNIAYLIVFIGLSKEGRPVLERILNERCKPEKVNEILNYFQSIPAKWDIEENMNGDENGCTEYDERLEKNHHHKYFGGHQHRLGHYFRHIFQTVNYVDKFEPYKNKYQKKYDYLKNYRAQFSTYEQAVFTYNSLSIFGRVWELNKTDFNRQLITKYNLIKNIPAEFVSKLDIKNYYPDVEYEGDQRTKSKKNMISKYQ